MRLVTYALCFVILFSSVGLYSLPPSRQVSHLTKFSARDKKTNADKGEEFSTYRTEKFNVRDRMPKSMYVTIDFELSCDQSNVKTGFCRMRNVHTPSLYNTHHSRSQENETTQERRTKLSKVWTSPWNAMEKFQSVTDNSR